MYAKTWFRGTSLTLATLVLSACNTLAPQPAPGLAGSDGLPQATPVRYPVAQTTHASPALPYPAHPPGCACCAGATQHPFAQRAVAYRPMSEPQNDVSTAQYDVAVDPSAQYHAAQAQYNAPEDQQYNVAPAQYTEPYCPPGGNCQPPAGNYCPPGAGYGPPPGPQPYTLPPQAFTGQYPATQPWAPPGIERPWPKEEYLCDGGDQGVKVRIGNDWSVHGLNQEDTVVHYDTIEGARVIEPTNKVCIYAPRFAAVRKLDGVLINKNRTKSAGVESPQPLGNEDQWLLATTAVQPVMPGRMLRSSAPISLEELQPGVEISRYLAAIDFHNVFNAYEDFTIIQRGILDEGEKARLAQSVANAVVWSTDQAAQVLLDRRQANVAEVVQSPQVTYQYNLDGKPRLQVCKVASKRAAQPGEIVEFTIRFDNIGSQTIGNVTIIDNLTTRLEYVTDSAQCNLDGQFLSQENEGESLVLRYEVTQPMKVGEGGILRFKCRVR